MLTRAHLREQAVAALKAADTQAGQNVFSPHDWPTWHGDYPAILVQTLRERKESVGRGLPQFNTVCWLAVTARAERKVERELLDDLKRITGKQNLLFELADAALAKPDGVVREVVFPVVGEQTLRDLVKEWKATGPTYRVTLRTVIRNSYQGHYRRMVPTLLAVLEFCFQQ